MDRHKAHPGRPAGLDRPPPPVISIVGRSQVGKTGLLEKLIPALKRRGYRVGTVKHHAHPGFEIDLPGKDSWRHARAGSDHVVIAGPDQIAAIRQLAKELTLEEIVAGMGDVDLVLTEGYSRAGKPAVEVIRASRGRKPIVPPERLLAVVSDVPLDLPVPCFGPAAVEALADLIEEAFL